MIGKRTGGKNADAKGAKNVERKKEKAMQKRQALLKDRSRDVGLAHPL